MSKKEKLRLRKELHEINKMNFHRPDAKIVEKAKYVLSDNPKSCDRLAAVRESTGVADA
jgi:hypothetical protein